MDDRTQMGDENADLVKLNVGGNFYMTSVATLTREPNSFFSDLFGSEGLELHKKVARRFRNGVYFIDRDGELFAYVLDYLRTGKLLLPECFRELARLREEVEFYRLEPLMHQLMPYYNLKYPVKATNSQGLNGNGNGLSPTPDSKQQQTAPIIVVNPLYETGGFITIGYRGTFAFGRDGQSDIKFRKLNRILVCGKVQLCREVFGDSLNESRDPDREGAERYTSRLYLKHQCFERACDALAEKGFKLITSCSSGANGLASVSAANTPQDIMNPRNSGDLEEQRWAHYTEYIFYREPQLNPFRENSPAPTPRT